MIYEGGQGIGSKAVLSGCRFVIWSSEQLLKVKARKMLVLRNFEYWTDSWPIKNRIRNFGPESESNFRSISIRRWSR